MIVLEQVARSEAVEEVVNEYWLGDGKVVEVLGAGLEEFVLCSLCQTLEEEI